MMKWKKTCLIASLAAALLVPTAVAANESDDYGPYHQDRGGDHIRAKHLHMMHERVHRQAYITLLSEKYTPERTNEWKQAFAERERLMKEVRALHGEVGKPSEEHMKTEEQMKSEGAGDKKKDEEKHARHEEMKKWHEQKMALYEEFTEAIRLQDNAKIKAVLPKLLEQTKEGNKRIAERIEQMKKKQ